MKHIYKANIASVNCGYTASDGLLYEYFGATGGGWGGFWEITAEKCPNLMKTVNSQIQEDQRTSSKRNMKETYQGTS